MGMTERIRRAFLFPYNFNYLANNLVESVDCKTASFVEDDMAVCCEYAVWVRSENGNGITTTSPFINFAILHLPLASANPF